MTTPIAIRHAAEGDAHELARLLTALGFPTEAQAVQERWAPWAGAGNSALVAVRDAGGLAGVATLHRMLVLHRPSPVGRITALVVDAACRGRGIGRALVEAAESQLAREGCGLLEVTSNLNLPEAHAFYARMGYERTSVRFAKRLAPAG
jgi:GNAT superfamily N-acetyltransferase